MSLKQGVNPRDKLSTRDFVALKRQSDSILSAIIHEFYSFIQSVC